MLRKPMVRSRTSLRPELVRHAAALWPLAGTLVMAAAQFGLGVHGVRSTAALKVAVRPAVPGEAWPMPVPSDWPASPTRWESARGLWSNYLLADNGRGASASVIQTGLPLRSAQGRRWYAMMGSVPSSTTPHGLSGSSMLYIRDLPLIGGPAALPTEVLWPGMAFNLILGAVCGWGMGTAVRRFAARRRARRGGCPACGYSRAGIAPGSRCPECGLLPGPGSRSPSGASLDQPLAGSRRHG